MSNRRVVWTKNARNDLKEIIEFIAEDSLQQAIAVLGRLKDKAQTLTDFPERGRIVPELQGIGVFHYHELIKNPWRLIYRYHKDEVYVMAVFDSRRDLENILLHRLIR